MKLSIVTVNLNNVDGLRKTAESIVSQTFQDFEWIVIDGGSTDGSKELIEHYSDHIAYWCSEKDSGIYNAMNKGVRHAKGEYVNFMNSGDSFVDERVLADIYNENHFEKILFGDVIIARGIDIIELRKYADEMSFYHFLRNTICHQSAFIYRDLLVYYPYKEEYKIAADFDFFVKMILMNESFKHIGRFVCNYQLGGYSDNNEILLYQERHNITSKNIPESITRDYSTGRLGEMIGLKERHPLYSKIITASILFMNWIERHSNKYGRKYCFNNRPLL